MAAQDPSHDRDHAASDGPAPHQYLYDAVPPAPLIPSPLERIKASFALWLLITFFIVNGFVLTLVLVMANRDQAVLVDCLQCVRKKELPVEVLTHMPNHVTPEVLMTLAGATVVQLGAAAFVLAKYFFSKQED